MAEIVDVLLRARMEASGVETGVGQIQKALKGLTLPKGISDDLEKSFNKLNPLLKDYQRQLNKGFSNKKDLQNFIALKNKIDEVFGDINSKIQQVNSKEIRLKTDTKAIEDAEKKVTKLSGDLQKAMDSIVTKKVNPSNINAQFDKILNSLTRATTLKPMTQTAKNLFNARDFAAYNAELDKMQNKINSLSVNSKFNFAKTIGFKGTIQDINGINDQINNFFNNIKANEGKVQSIERLKQELRAAGQEASKLKLDAAARGAEALSKAGNGINALKNNLHSVGDGARQAVSGLLSAKEQVEQLKYSTQYFFSLRNMFNLLKRGIDEAVQSVKELDKAMTETAVVTDFKVSDMWNMLPEYTELANKLGATTQGAYETMTLYFQQGLGKQATFEIGEETMKMARIAGLDYADTTNMMTAALRGFNMELNKTSAEKVNDVYSKLAAITASDTKELGSAMERTASIAHSANMDFGNTAAFLAQMIETTREAPENLGTAMKTIIARFQELKKAPGEIAEVEGEEVSFNRIDTALKTIGVDLMDNKDKFRDLDDVFMDIASKWDSLTQTQQRYIATTAAGSRQQSRFLAMMQDYSRLQELTDAAANSEGASQKQFEKTLDSFESKVNKLKNAWQQFTMGIANNQFVKGFVGGITGILDVTNKLIDTLSLGNGAIKSFLSLFTAFAGLKVGGRVINGLVGALGGLVDPTVGFGAGLKGGLIGNRQASNANLASQIYSPIVAELRAIHNLQAQELNNSLNSKIGRGNKLYDEHRRFKEARQGIIGLGSGTHTVKELEKHLKGLTSDRQNLLMRSNSGTFRAATNSIMQKYLPSVNAGNKDVFQGLLAGERYLNDLRTAGKITTEQYIKALQNPSMVRQAIQSADPSGRHNAAVQYLDNFTQQISTLASQRGNQKARAREARLIERNEELKAQGSSKARSDAQMQRILNRVRQPEMQKILDEMFGGSEFKVSKIGKLLNGIGNVGSGIASAGMGIQAFASILISSANPAIAAFGGALNSIGGMLSSLGMLTSGLASGFSAIASSKLMMTLGGAMPTKLISAFGGAAGAASALTGGLALLVAAVGGVIYAYKKHNENIKKAAEDLTENYKKNSEEVSSNIADLESYKGDYNRLSSGVDQNGMNINLADSDYARYLEIVDKIAEINPEIVEGYNSQGHAIIRNNSALEKTLDLEKERQNTLIDDYTSKNSIQTLKEARDLEKREKRIAKVMQRSVTGETVTEWKSTGDYEFIPQAKMRQQAQEAARIWNQGIKEGWASEDLFADIGINVNDLIEGQDEAVKTFDRYSSEISSKLTSAMDLAGSEVNEKTKENFANIMSQYSDASDEMAKLIEPMYNQLSTKMAQKKAYKDIPEEMVTYFNQGLKDIVSDANIENVNKEANKLVAHFSELTGEGTKYSRVMEQIATAQEKFADTRDEDKYNKAAQKAVDKLEKIKAGIGDTTTGYGKALSEFLDNQITQIQEFTEEGAVNITEALNTMTDEIAAAEGALENFNGVAEGSNFSTAADNMKQIYDTITEKDSNTGINKHAEGKGDQTYWAGAESLIGRDNLKNKSKAEVDKMLKTIGPMLEEGEKGFDAFANHWYDNVEKIKEAGIEGLTLDKETGWFETFDDVLNPEVYKEVASVLGMSEDTLVSMLNKGRQFADIDFANVEQVRQALSTSDSVITGNKTNKKGKKAFYIKDETLNAELSNAGILDVNAQEEEKKRLREEQNIRTIADASKISIKRLEDMGAATQESLIKTFGDTGEFSKEEIQKYAERLAELNGEEFDKKGFNEDYKNYLDSLDSENATLISIESYVSTIASIINRDNIEKGHLDNPKAHEAKKTLLGDKGKDTEAQIFASGTNKKGKPLSDKKYNEGKEKLEDFISTSEAYVEELKVGLNNAKTKAEREKIQQEIDEYEKDIIPKANQYLEDGIAAHEEFARTGVEVGKAQKAVYEWFNQQGFGNTDFFGRNSNLIQWGENPSKDNKRDWRNLKTWETDRNPIRQKDWAGQVSSYWSQGSHFGSNEKGKGAELSFTPILQTDDGKLKVLARENVEAYLNAITEAASDKEGNIDIGKLMKLDEEGYKDFVDEEGNKLHGLLLGAFTGQQSGASDFLGRFEHQLSETLINDDLIQGAQNVATLCDGLNQLGDTGVAASSQIKQAFLEMNSEGLSKLSPEELKPIQDALNLTKQDLQKIGEYGSSFNFADIFKNFKPDFSSLWQGFVGADKGGKIGDVLNLSSIAEKAKAKIKEIFSGEGQTLELPAPKLGEKFTSVIKTAKEKVKSIFTGDNSTPEIKQPKQPKQTKEDKQPKKQKSTVENTITLESKVKNPKEPKKKIEKAIPKTVKKSVPVTVTTTTTTKKAKSEPKKGPNSKDKTTVNETKLITVNANTAPAMAKINALLKKFDKTYTVKYTASGPSSISVPIYASFRGSWQKTVTITKGHANGKDNRFPRSIPISTGSLAKGSRYGTIGPRDKGGLTLTGEKGFEIAWLPSENRSMILGTKGPQMVNLPRDAVVYTHEQSKDILKKRQSIEAGSHYTTSKPYKPKNSGSHNGGGNGHSGGGSKSGGNSGGDGGQSKKNQKKQTKILQKAGKINAWWWNMTKRVEATQRKIDQLNKKIEKTIDKIGTTLSSISGEVTEYIKKLKQQIGLNTEMLEKADKKLGILSGERTSKKTKDAKKAVKEDKKRLKKARKTDSKQDDKKAKKRLKKDQKELKKSQKGVNWARISYDVIKKKGKKKTKKSKKKRINLSPYIYLDPDTGAYNVDYDKINEEIGLDHRNKKGKKVQGNKSKAKATMEAAEKRIEKYQGRHDTAEDNIDKAQDALDELGQKLYETFFAWETELTKIWNVTQKIAEAESKRGRAESFSELLDAQVADGTISSKNKLLGQDYFDKINTAFTKGINEQISSINLTKESIDLKKANLQDLLNGETERKTLENVKDIIDYSSAYGEWDNLATDTQKTIKQTDKKIKNAEKDKEGAQKAIKKDNKIINSKKSTKKEKKAARQDKKEAKQDKKEATATINAYTELKDSLSDTLATANQEMQNILNAGYKELDAGELLAYQTEQSALEDQLKIVEAANAYMRPEIKDDGTISVNFNTEDFERDKQSGLLNSTTAEKIQEYVKKIVDETQDLHDTYKDLTEKITELHSTLADLQDAWVGYSEDLMSYLEDAQEVDIEKYKSLSDSIRDALEKLLDQVKKNLEERRKQEDNAKTERDISQKQQRLAALRADTSGGHQVEIAQLEKEIADAQLDYGRNLEDQLLDRLNDQADAAAEQRERIIELEEAINSAVNNAETVNKWMENPGQFKEEIRAAVYKAKDYQNLTKAQQEQVDRQTDQLLVGLETNPKKTEEVKNAINQMTALVEFLEGSLNEVGDNVEENKDNTDSIDDKVTSVINSLRGNIDAVTQAVESVDNTLQKNETAEVERQSNAAASAQAAETTKNESAYKLAVANAKSNGTITANQFNKAISAGATLNKSAGQVVQDLKTSQLTWKEILTAAHNAGWGPKKIKDLNRNASKGSAFRDAWESIFPNKKWNEYATGGLASYTGPAWLDGTPSKPELVLNPTDTKNFIALRDVLGKTMGNISNSNESLTNAMYEININVDHINSDYDVDKIAARIKKDIIKDAGYRNVTQVRNLR